MKYGKIILNEDKINGNPSYHVTHFDLNGRPKKTYVESMLEFRNYFVLM